jgi:hypothetical protein
VQGLRILIDQQDHFHVLDSAAPNLANQSYLDLGQRQKKSLQGAYSRCVLRAEPETPSRNQRLEHLEPSELLLSVQTHGTSQCTVGRDTQPLDERDVNDLLALQLSLRARSARPIRRRPGRSPAESAERGHRLGSRLNQHQLTATRRLGHYLFILRLGCLEPGYK